jgi:hypothetical protein
MAVASATHGDVADHREIYKVPDPLPLTIGGMIAAVGPQAINFGISIGGGEAYLLPNVAARGALGWHWLMVISVIVETALVYECIKYSCCTGRSFFAGTNELGPRGFWPWFWAVAAILTWAWPAWMGGAVIAAQRFTGISTPQGWTLFGQALPPQYIWAVLALVLVLVVFYFSNRTYAFLEWFFKVIMVVNIVLVLAITVIAAKPEDYWIILKAYAGVLFFYPEWTKAVTPLDIVALYNQPGGSLMWVSFWVVAAGWGMGRYSGQVTGVLRPPEHITAQELRWNTNDPQEVAKMQQWVRLGGMSLIIWWAIIGGLIMTYLYSVAGYAYLHNQFLATGKVPSGVEVPLQMAIVAQGVMGQAAGALMLIVIMVTLYDAQFPFYDTFIGRTTTDAIAVTTRLEEKIPYRVWYFVVVTAAVLAGFYLVLQQQPFFMWLMVAVAAVVYRCIGSVQIMMINNRRLPPEFKVSALNTFILWFSFVTGLVAVGYWGYNSWGEIMKRFAG